MPNRKAVIKLLFEVGFAKNLEMRKLINKNKDELETAFELLATYNSNYVQRQKKECKCQ